MMRGQALEQLGEHESALEAPISASRFSGQNSKALLLRVYILAKTGRADEARAMLRTLGERTRWTDEDSRRVRSPRDSAAPQA